MGVGALAHRGAFCGWLGASLLDGRIVLAGMAEPLGAARQDSFDSAACAVSGGTSVAFEDGVHVVIVGRPRWRDTEALPPEDVAKRLHEAWNTVGANAVESLLGSFAVVLIDHRQQRMLAAVDRLGVHQLYFSKVGPALVFATHLPLMRGHPGFDAHIDPQAIYDYLYFHMIPSPRTIFAGTSKLKAGHLLEWSPGQPQRQRAYWMPRFGGGTADLRALSREMMEAIRGGVDRALVGTQGNVAAFLSGGLDSSTVSGMLSRARPMPSTYSMGFDVEGFDEIHYARVAARHFGTDAHEYYVKPEDVAQHMIHVATGCDEPFGNSSLLPTYCCARLAASEGAGLLLAGDGGDELFGGNTRYAKQAVFELYGRMPGALQGLVAAGASMLGPVPLLRKAKSYVDQARIPLPDRLDTYAYLNRHAPESIFTSSFLSAVDTGEPPALRREAYEAPEHGDTLDRMLHLDWHFTLHDNDLVKVNTACRLAGVDVAYPLLDDDLVALSCRVPSAWKIKGTQLRWFYKQAMRGFLPAEILDKRKHGFGLPFGVWTRSDAALQALTHGAVRALGQRGWFEPAFLEDTLRRHREEHAGYYGELVWILAVLEFWMQAHAPAA
ncbi:MAG: asparagine synthase C-terminal domain-containing protein [Burkholderiales bacterium]|nr:asparagine synthase C-terminal domain-containing protein [Burkholderiales bacterium]